MNNKKRDIHKYSRSNRLQYAYNKRLFSGFLKLGKTEFVAYRKGNKAKSNIGNNAYIVKLFIALEAKARYIEKTEEAGSDKYT